MASSTLCLKVKHLQFLLAPLGLFLHYCHCLAVVLNWGRISCIEEDCAVEWVLSHNVLLSFIFAVGGRIIAVSYSCKFSTNAFLEMMEINTAVPVV